MRKDELLTRGGTKGFPHPLEPVVTAFSSIASAAGGYKIFSKRIATTTAWLNVIQGKFARRMFNTAVDAF